MKEYKFRAWDGEKVRQVFSIDFTDGREIAAASDDSNQPQYIPLASNPLMQYTGLVDKNGKEIYEGDILQFDQGFGAGTTNHVVKWSEQSAGWDIGLDDEPYMNQADAPRFFTVIGNVHENPELLRPV